MCNQSAPSYICEHSLCSGRKREGERKRERGRKILSTWVLKKLERFQVLGERRGGVDVRFHGPNQLIIPKQFYCRLPGG